jgi:hypothetical protein
MEPLPHLFLMMPSFILWFEILTRSDAACRVFDNSKEFRLEEGRVMTNRKLSTTTSVGHEEE